MTPPLRFAQRDPGGAGLLALCVLALTTAGSLRGQSIDPRFPVKITSDIEYAAPLRLDIYEPAGPEAPRVRPAFVAVHGGGLTRGDKASPNMVELCRELASRGFVCASISYRLRPAASAGALHDAVEDACRALAWIGGQASALKIDPRRIVLGGSSAGATIALRLGYLSPPSAAKIAAVVSWSGSLYAPADRIEATEPPLFIVHGAADMVVGVEEARRLARRAKAIALPHAVFLCEGIGHNMPLDRRPLGQPIYRHLALFLAESFGDTTAATHEGIEPVSCPK